jgi:hypothetical protein
MAIIDPEGLFEGERLAACSDLAQLYWQRLFLAANSCGRMEMTYASIIGKVFKTFRNPPTEEALWSVFEELERCYLVILYEVDGVWWCQFVTSEKYLPKYKKARDEASPTPSFEMISFHAEGYRNWKKQRNVKNQSFRKSLEMLRNSSEEFLRRGIGEVIGEVVVKELEKRGTKKEAAPETSPTLAQTDFDASTMVREIVCAHPKSKLRSMAAHEVTQRQEIAVLEAMAVEMKRGRCSEAEALAVILQLTRQLADKVPRSEWRFFKDVPDFFRSLDYRVEPENFTNSAASKGRASGPTAANSSKARVERSADTFKQVLIDSGDYAPGFFDSADPGLPPEPRVEPTHIEGIPGVVSGASPSPQHGARGRGAEKTAT